MTTSDPGPQKKGLTHNGFDTRVLLIGNDSVLSRFIRQGLTERGCNSDQAVGSADALQRLRRTTYDAVITDPATSIEEDLALMVEMRAIRPGLRIILLAPGSTPEGIIFALRARVFLCKCPPFDAMEIAEYAAHAAADAGSVLGIEILAAHRDWVSIRMNSRRLTGERLISFFKELQTQIPSGPREDLMMAFREILMNAIEHGAESNPDKVIEVAAVHTERAIVFNVRDPGPGFRWQHIPHAAVSNPDNDAIKHIEMRERQGLPPGGFGILMTRGIVDELIYSEVGNEVLLIKHTR